ncbi:MAG TPA: serine/threonine-protein kinase [Nitrospirota bacterium]|nr:serine/threonine-protein kinase [Nitrospirota bacterium]
MLTFDKTTMKRLLKNRYEITGVLGQGGMGCVYKVADRSRGGMVLAVKELHPGKLSPDKAREAVVQFQTEARILTRFSHPNLPKVFDYFTEAGAYYIVMEYIRGRTLEKILDGRRGKPVDEKLALSWALQISRAVHFLSVQRPRPVVFRDLKPSNIMIDRVGRVKLIDFGIARFFKEDKIEDTYVYGTPGYAAPEQYGVGQTDVRSDIFSLGATMHHCLTGRSPAEDPHHFPDPRRVNRKLSRETAAVITKALAPDRDKRFQSAHEMKAAIQKVLLALSIPARRRGDVIYARPGKMIRLPWWKKVSWVSVPVMALGLSGTTGTLSTDDLWIAPKPATFGTDASWILFRVKGRLLKPGREYRPRIIVKTDAGVLRPQLLFKRQWPWLLINAVAIALAAAMAAMVMTPGCFFRLG